VEREIHSLTTHMRYSFCGCVGVFNALQGCDGEIEMSPGLTEATMGQVR
jgi:hypothetical protein